MKAIVVTDQAAGTIKWVAKEDPAGQARFMGSLFGIAA